MEDLAVITALNQSSSFEENFVLFKEKIKMLFTSLGRSVLGKLGLEYHPSTTSRPRAQFFSIRTSRLVNNICFFFFSEGKVTNLAVSLVLSAVRIFLPLPTGTVTLARTSLASLPFFL